MPSRSRRVARWCARWFRADRTQMNAKASGLASTRRSVLARCGVTPRTRSPDAAPQPATNELGVRRELRPSRGMKELGARRRRWLQNVRVPGCPSSVGGRTSLQNASAPPSHSAFLARRGTPRAARPRDGAPLGASGLRTCGDCVPRAAWRERPRSGQPPSPGRRGRRTSKEWRTPRASRSRW